MLRAGIPTAAEVFFSATSVPVIIIIAIRQW
jgi:hypothetical protein